MYAFSDREKPFLWAAVDLGNCPKSKSSRKWLGEGAKGLSEPASKRPLALVRNGVAPVQERVWVVQRTLGRPLLPGPKKKSKRPLAPSPNHFWRLSLFGRFPRSTASQPFLGTHSWLNVEIQSFRKKLPTDVFFPGRNYIRPPPPPPISGQKSFFRGGGWGCISWAPTRQEFYTPPPPFLYAPHR